MIGKAVSVDIEQPHRGDRDIEVVVAETTDVVLRILAPHPEIALRTEPASTVVRPDSPPVRELVRRSIDVSPERDPVEQPVAVEVEDAMSLRRQCRTE